MDATMFLELSMMTYLCFIYSRVLFYFDVPYAVNVAILWGGALGLNHLVTCRSFEKSVVASLQVWADPCLT